jgi:hypothetical protein
MFILLFYKKENLSHYFNKYDDAWRYDKRYNPYRQQDWHRTPPGNGRNCHWAGLGKT